MEADLRLIRGVRIKARDTLVFAEVDSENTACCRSRYGKLRVQGDWLMGMWQLSSCHAHGLHEFLRRRKGDRMAEGQISRRDLMRQLAAVRERLREFGIRDASDYAEVLVAEALAGQRSTSRVNKGHDVLAELYGRVEVKCRQLPPDGRIEERVEIGAGKEGGFEFLAVVIFRADFSVKGAVVVPYAAVWELVARQEYNRVSYSQACQLPGAVDITPGVHAASER